MIQAHSHERTPPHGKSCSICQAFADSELFLTGTVCRHVHLAFCVTLHLVCSRWLVQQHTCVSHSAVMSLHSDSFLKQDPLQIESYNGSAIVAMAGEKCVAIGSDLRFGVQMQTMATDHQKVTQIHDRLFIGLSGLGTDQARV